MPLLDIFKKKKEEKPASAEAMVGKEKKIPEVKAKKPKKKEGLREVFPVLEEPHISEKTTNLGKENRYVFKVYPKANKTEVKKAIESVYGVDVLAVNIIKIPRKKRRFKKTFGFKRGYKKAIVHIKEGQKIETL